jgi:hypothetical protein
MVVEVAEVIPTHRRKIAMPNVMITFTTVRQLDRIRRKRR